MTRRHDVLLIADEVAVGFGRTGKMFACEHEGVSPDLLCLAKGITGGYLPLAATLATDDVYEAFLGEYEEFKTFFHGHTYTGNPLGAAVGLASLDIFAQDRVIEGLAAKIELLAGRLAAMAEHPHVGDIRQRGLMVGIELVADKGSREPFPIGPAHRPPGDPGRPGAGSHSAPPGGCHRAAAAAVHHRGRTEHPVRHYPCGHRPEAPDR